MVSKLSEEEDIRIDVVKKSPFVMEIRILYGDELFYKHTIELNPEVFSEEDAQRIMEAWAKILQLQAYTMHMWRGLADKFFRTFFDDSLEDE